MRWLLRLLLALCFAIALGRAAAFLAYAAYELSVPTEAYHLEAKSAHLAWRVQAGAALYPEWRAGPRHVANFFGPLYFLVVGGLARVLGADLPGLILIGRVATIGSGLAAALLVALASGRREGGFAGAFAGLLAIGSAPMIGYGVMVRPDVFADLLGFAGFLLAVGGGGAPSRRRFLMGAALLVAAVFAKQTTALYLASAVLAIALTGSWRRAAALAAGAAAASAAIVAAVTLAVEPRFAADLLGEAGTPSSVENWRQVLWRFWTIARELPILIAVGVGLWVVRRPRDLPWLLPSLALLIGAAAALALRSSSPDRLVALFAPAVPLGAIGFWAALDPRRPRDVPMATLAAVQLVGAAIAALKLGSDLNYFLGPRLPAAMAAGAIWGAVQRFATPGGAGEGPASRFRAPRGIALAIGLALFAYSLFPGLAHDHAQMDQARRIVRLVRGPGRAAEEQRRQIYELAADPDAAILTDTGLVQLYQRERAPFADPWLFRVMVTTGRIRPDAIRERLIAGEYALVITSRDLFGPSYDTYDFGLPPELAEAARTRYVPAGTAGGLYLYAPRPAAPAVPRGSPGG